MTQITTWYQRKIGTYDKQEWETTVEQRIVQGLQNFPTKSTKLRPDLIDVDLIRGSSFPKAKPVQGFATIFRLALARVFLLPFWTNWWTAHTSMPAMRIFVFLWILQFINTILYFVAPSAANIDSSCILVPVFLMAGLGIVHACIVSTAHPHSSGFRCLSYNLDGRHSNVLSTENDNCGNFRCSNASSNDIFNSSSDFSQTKNHNSPFYLVNKLTQTESCSNNTFTEKCNDPFKRKWKKDLEIPSVCLTSPANQCVKFNLDNFPSKDKKSSGKNVKKCFLLKLQRQHNNLRVAKISTEDDGFESLNGNNSNGSENGDDSINYNRNNEDDGNETDIENNDKNDPEEHEEDNDETTKGNRKEKQVNFNSDSNCECCEESKDNVYEEYNVNNNEDGVRFRHNIQYCRNTGMSKDINVDHKKYDVNWFKYVKKDVSRPEIQIRKPRNGRNTHITSSSDEECDTASASLDVPSRRTTFVRTNNSEECSYYSEHDESESEGLEGDSTWEPFTILNPDSERISCTVWENGHIVKVQMSVVDISHSIVKRADQVLSRNDCGLWLSTCIATILAALLPLTRLLQVLVETGNESITVWDLPFLFLNNSPMTLLYAAFGATVWEKLINLFSTLLRFGLGIVTFFLLAVAQQAFNQRFLYAKLFSHLTSTRRARQSSLPHFRLNRVRNIKTWLSVRSYLMRRGPQRSVDIIVSAAFVLLILLISFLVIDLLQDQGQRELSHVAEALGWTVLLGVVLLRLVALGTRASRKHRCLPVLLTEQINLHLAMERRPASKERLSVANNVLKLAADLLKELDSPFKISGLSGNPYLYTITKVVVLSALSGVLSDLLGFKLKLHKIKIK